MLRNLLTLSALLALNAGSMAANAAFDHQAYLKSANQKQTQRGRAVAVSGARVIVSGVAGQDEGNVVIYQRQASGEWQIVFVLKADNSDSGDEYGSALAIDGDTIVVGAPNEDSGATGIGGNPGDDSAENSGAVYVYVRGEDHDWRLEAYIKSSNSQADDFFGSAVSIDGDTLIVGAPGEDSGATGVGGNPADNSVSLAGAAYVFKRNEGVWAQQAYLKAGRSDSGDTFGSSVSIFQDWAVVGAPFEQSAATGSGGNQDDNSLQGAGAVYPFFRQGENWQPLGYLKASNTESNDFFGSAVDITGSPTVFGTNVLVAVGAPGEASRAVNVNGDQADNGAPGAGAVYLILGNGVGAWGQTGYLKASNTDAGDEFGASVAVNEGPARRVVVGASREDSLGAGVDGVSNDNSASNAGAAYVFSGSNVQVSPEHYFKASNTDESDRFGFSVAADGALIVVGAPLEDSSAIGVGGDQDDDSADASGAAYILGLPDRLFADRFGD